MIINFFKNTTLIIVSIIITLYFAEAILSFHKLYENNEIFNNTESNVNKNDNSKEKFDTRSKIQIYNDLINENNKDYIFNFVFKEVYLNRFKKYLKNENILPLGGKSLTNVIHCNESGYWSIYKSDRYGFNNLDKIWDNKKSKIFLLGDSFTHGACVNYESTLAGWFNKKIDRYSTLSLGSDAKGPILSYASLREYYTPDTDYVIYFFYEGNDLIDLNRELKNKTLVKYYSDNNFSQNLIKKQNIIDEAWQNMFLDSSKNLLKARILRFLKLRFVSETFINFRKSFLYKNEFQTIDNANIQNLENVVLQMKKFSDKKNANYIFVYLPSVHRFFTVNDGTYGYKSYDKIIEMLKKNKINYVDINKELFEKSNNPKQFFPFQKKNHYTDLTYKKIVEIIKKNFFKD